MYFIIFHHSIEMIESSHMMVKVEEQLETSRFWVVDLRMRDASFWWLTETIYYGDFNTSYPWKGSIDWNTMKAWRIDRNQCRVARFLDLSFLIPHVEGDTQTIDNTPIGQFRVYVWSWLRKAFVTKVLEAHSSHMLGAPGRLEIGGEKH